MGVYFDNQCTASELSINVTLSGAGNMTWYTTSDGVTHFNGDYSVSNLNYKGLLLTDIPTDCGVEFFNGDFTACPLDIVSSFEPDVCGVPSNGSSSYIYICSGQRACASSILPPGATATTVAPQASTTSTAATSTDSTTASAQVTSTSSTTSSSSTPNEALIAGLTVPLVILVIVVIVLLYWFIWRPRASKKASVQRNADESAELDASGTRGDAAQRQTHELDGKPQMHELGGLPGAHELEGRQR